ncbi:hypothetical protein SAMN04490197_2727 [Pseudomonas orientalis]|uniref:Uncharacterized protein n=1 Tax=Pseudomonas orientalis TaxID=76758 RepID=A0A1H2FNM4_9PSED|nr:hypothetical protein TU82_15760 [Pseudomonas orientalis]SDU08977.1 hypothetical protein SAMN04490197_2727 [Pseudomonas orientalis]
MEINTPTLELKLDNGKTLSVEVVSYHLKFNEKLHVGVTGKIHKIGTFKINSSAYKSWGPVKAIKYATGECSVVTGHPPKMTLRTITYKISQDF